MKREDAKAAAKPKPVDNSSWRSWPLLDDRAEWYGRARTCMTGLADLVRSMNRQCRFTCKVPRTLGDLDEMDDVI